MKRTTVEKCDGCRAFDFCTLCEKGPVYQCVECGTVYDYSNGAWSKEEAIQYASLSEWRKPVQVGIYFTDYLSRKVYRVNRQSLIVENWTQGAFAFRFQL